MSFLGIEAADAIGIGLIGGSVGEASGQKKGSPQGEEKKMGEALSIPALSSIGCCCGCMMLASFAMMMYQKTMSGDFPGMN